MRMVWITLISPTKTSASVTEQDYVAGVDCVAGKALAGYVSIHHICFLSDKGHDYTQSCSARA